MKAMTYEETKPSTKPSKEAVTKAVNLDLNGLNTSRLIGHIIWRHRVLLLVAWAVWITIVHFMPGVPMIAIELVRSAF